MFFLLLLPTLSSQARAQTEPRWALVIGNDAYQHVDRLKAAVSDAAAMAAALRQLRFEVLERSDLDRPGMYRALRDLAERAPGSITIVYYAGHGVQVRGRSFLLPVDIDARSEGDVEDNAVLLDDVLSLLAGARANLTVVFIDACRNNPLPAAGRGIERGLAEPRGLPRGQMVVYAAGAGEEALDRLGPDDKSPNGLFVRELLPELQRPGVALHDAVDAAAARVAQEAAAIGHEQHPAVYKAYYGQFYLVPGPSAPVEPRGQATDTRSEEDRTAFARVRDRVARLTGPEHADLTTEVVRPSIAVLPFDGTSGGEDALARGLAEDVLTELSRSRDLKVIARDSSFGLAVERLQSVEIGRRLDVRYLLEGSARRSGDELRIDVRLLDTANGEHIWADRYAAGSSDLYAAEDQIVREITGRLVSEVRESEKAQALRRPPGSLDVYELTMKGLAEKHRLDRDSLMAARVDLRRALELDPGYTPAQLYLAQVDLLDIGSGGLTGTMGPDDLPDVIARMRHAVDLDPNSSEGYRILSQALGRSGDTEGAVQAALRSVQLAPSNADNLNSLGVAQIRAGRYAEALRNIETALDLNPLGPAWYQVYKAQAFYALDRAADSLGPANACAVQASRWVFCYLIKAAALSALGRQDEARASVAALLALNPRYDIAIAIKLTPFPADARVTARYVADLRRAGLPDVPVADIR